MFVDFVESRCMLASSEPVFVTFWQFWELLDTPNINYFALSLKESLANINCNPEKRTSLRQGYNSRPEAIY